MGRVPPDFSVSTHLQHEMVWGTEVYVGVGVGVEVGSNCQSITD